MEPLTHQLEECLIRPVHPIRVLLVGVGGTGSQVLNCLARINYALRKLNHPGLHVTAIDADVVDEFNVGRQLFSQSEIGINKAVCAVTKINRFFGFSWEAEQQLLTAELLNNNLLMFGHSQNIIITCVDNVRTRRLIHNHPYKKVNDEFQTYYWMDFGNNEKTGQVILSSVRKLHRTLDKGYLKNVFDIFPKMEEYESEELQGPSCSMAEALGRQDLFINSTLAQLGCNLLWKLLYEKKINYQGVFLNLETMHIAPIAIKVKIK